MSATGPWPSSVPAAPACPGAGPAAADPVAFARSRWSSAARRAAAHGTGSDPGRRGSRQRHDRAAPGWHLVWVRACIRSSRHRTCIGIRSCTSTKTGISTCTRACTSIGTSSAPVPGSARAPGPAPALERHQPRTCPSCSRFSSPRARARTASGLPHGALGVDLQRRAQPVRAIRLIGPASQTAGGMGGSSPRRPAPPRSIRLAFAISAGDRARSLDEPHRRPRVAIRPRPRAARCGRTVTEGCLGACFARYIRGRLLAMTALAALASRHLRSALRGLDGRRTSARRRRPGSCWPRALLLPPPLSDPGAPRLRARPRR